MRNILLLLLLVSFNSQAESRYITASELNNCYITDWNNYQALANAVHDYAKANGVAKFQTAKLFAFLSQRNETAINIALDGLEAAVVSNIPGQIDMPGIGTIQISESGKARLSVSDGKLNIDNPFQVQIQPEPFSGQCIK